MRDLLLTKQCKSRNVDRMVPLQLIVAGYLPDVTSAITQTVSRGFPADRPCPWAVACAVRLNDNLKKKELVPLIAKAVDASSGHLHPVNLDDPEVTVILEGFGPLAGVSIVTDRQYTEFERYNVRMATETAEEREARLSTAAAQEAAALAKRQRDASGSAAGGSDPVEELPASSSAK